MMKLKQQLTNTTTSMDANKRNEKLVTWVCFLAYLLLLGYMLFFSAYFGREDHAEYRYNLSLFQEIGRYIGLGIRTGSWTLFYVNVVGNVCAFVPLGVFLPKLFEKCRNIVLVTILSLKVSLAVEVIQLVTRVGSFDVDDLLLNTLGGLIGFFIYKIFSIGKKHK